MLSMTARTTVLAATTLLAAPALAQDATAEAPAELAEASTALEAATSLGLVETLASGEAYTAFIPTNDALAAVQGEATDSVMADEAAFATLIQGYVIEGNVMAADAMTLVTDGGGTASVDSLAGTPIELAMEGESLTVNGQPVGTADLMLGNVTIHLLDGAFLPEAGTEG
jgi:uncharacterized surface protein with fasciclin (FAS1) repeats